MTVDFLLQECVAAVPENFFTILPKMYLHGLIRDRILLFLPFFLSPCSTYALSQLPFLVPLSSQRKGKMSHWDVISQCCERGKAS